MQAEQVVLVDLVAGVVQGMAEQHLLVEQGIPRQHHRRKEILVVQGQYLLKPAGEVVQVALEVQAPQVELVELARLIH
jgi:hypothetical protein